MRTKTLFAALMAAGALVACGGGDGGSKSSSQSGSRASAASIARGATSQATSVFIDAGSTLGALTGADTGSKVHAQQFIDAMSAAQLPVDLVLKDGAALLMGAQLFNDFIHGRGPSQRGGMPAAAGELPQREVACGVYTAPASGLPTRLATTADAANLQLWCATVFWRDDVARQAVGHLFKLTPALGADGNVVSLAVSGQRDAWADGRFDLQDAPRALTLSVGFNTAGNLARYALAGDLPAHYRVQSGDPYNPGGASRLALSGVVVSANGQQNLTMQGADGGAADGTLTVYQVGTAQPEASLTLKSGSTLVLAPGASGAWDPLSAHIDLEWAAAELHIAGSLALADYTADKSATRRLPATTVFSAMLAKLGQGHAADYLGGKLTITLSKLGSWDATLPRAVQNDYDIDSRYTGSTAAGVSPALAIDWHTRGRSGAAGWESLEGELQLQDASGQLPHRIFLFQGAADSSGAAATLSMQEKISGISFSGSLSDRKIPILKDGSTVIGNLDRDGNPPGAYFADGTVMPLNWL